MCGRGVWNIAQESGFELKECTGWCPLALCLLHPACYSIQAPAVRMHPSFSLVVRLQKRQFAGAVHNAVSMTANAKRLMPVHIPSSIHSIGRQHELDNGYKVDSSFSPSRPNYGGFLLGQPLLRNYPPLLAECRATTPRFWPLITLFIEMWWRFLSDFVKGLVHYLR